MELEHKQLDLSTVDLYGWQAYIPKLNLDLLDKKIKNGLIVPEVPVYKIDDNTYQLIMRSKVTDDAVEETDSGGHKRSYLDFHSNKLLEVVVQGQQDAIYFGNFKPINTKDIQLSDDKIDHFLFNRMLEQHPEYR